MKLKLKINFTPKKFQERIIDAAFDDNVKKLIIVAARQIGKSYVLRYVMLRYLLERKVDVAYQAPTNKLCKEVFTKFSRCVPSDLTTKLNNSDLVIEIINGSRLFFISNEAVDNVRGLTLDYLICDEAAHYREVSPSGNHWWYHICSPFLDAKNGKLIMISTPNGAQGYFYNECMKAKSGKDGYAYVQASIYDDETKTIEWIEQKKDEYPSKAWKQEFECDFLSSGISYFEGFESLFDADFDEKCSSIWVGIDLSANGTDNTVVTFINEKNQVRQFLIQGGLDDKYNRIASLINAYSDKMVWINAETNGVGSPMINEIRKKLDVRARNVMGEWTTTNTTKADGIPYLAWMIEKGDIHFERGNETLMEEFKTFIQKKTKTGLDQFAALEGSHDDTVMSLHIAVEAKRKHGKVSHTRIAVFRR